MGRLKRSGVVVGGFALVGAWLASAFLVFVWVVDAIHGDPGRLLPALLAGLFFAASTAWIFTRKEPEVAASWTDEQRVQYQREHQPKPPAGPRTGWRLVLRRIAIGLGIALASVWAYLVLLGPSARERCEESGGVWIAEVDGRGGDDSYCDHEFF